LFLRKYETFSNINCEANIKRRIKRGISGICVDLYTMIEYFEEAI